jgi:hypothetical protein
VSGKRGAGSGERGAGSGERGGERGAGSGERGAGSGERGAGSGERGAGSGERGAESRKFHFPFLLFIDLIRPDSIADISLLLASSSLARASSRYDIFLAI